MTRPTTSLFTTAPKFQRTGNSSQKGASLFVALVTLVIITLAGIALVRSVDTGMLVAGNLTFKEASLSATDVGLEEANLFLRNTIMTAGTGVYNSNFPSGCANAVSATSLGTCRYFARTQPESTDGSLFIDWTSANIPITTLNGSYQIQYVIDRLCTADTSIGVTLLGPPAQMNNAAYRCHTTFVDPGGSKKGGAVPPPDSKVAIQFRITVRVVGPRNATSIVQTIVGY